MKPEKEKQGIVLLMKDGRRSLELKRHEGMMNMPLNPENPEHRRFAYARLSLSLSSLLPLDSVEAHLSRSDRSVLIVTQEGNLLAKRQQR